MIGPTCLISDYFSTVALVGNSLRSIVVFYGFDPTLSMKNR